MTPLRQQLIDALQLRGLAANTIKNYVSVVAKYARHFGRSPDRLGRAELQQYLLHLVNERKVAQGTYNRAVAALRFFYREILSQGDVVEGLCFSCKERKLPEVFSHEEVERFFAALVSLKHRAILMAAYGSGLRVSEAVALRVKDIDSQRMLLRVQQGKGRKDRYVMLPERLLVVLRQYWHAARPTDYLFPSRSQQGHLSRIAVYNACRRAATEAGIVEGVQKRWRGELVAAV